VDSEDVARAGDRGSELAELTLRPMRTGDLSLVAGWLREPHVARWWTEDPADEIAGYERCVSGLDPTRALIVSVAGEPIGWCQWYRWGDYPEADEYGATADDIGLDYAIGEIGRVGRGLGTVLIARLVAEIRRERPGASILVSVDVDNIASRRVLERNGFALVDERAVPSEPEDRSALYRRHD
jgi:aminoglycoside 6'-N-acetyltransferase